MTERKDVTGLSRILFAAFTSFLGDPELTKWERQKLILGSQYREAPDHLKYVSSGHTEEKTKKKFILHFYLMGYF